MVCLAQAGVPPTPDALWSAWNLHPLVLVALVAAAAWYWHGMRRLWAAAGRGNAVSRGQARAFAVGLAVVALALTSPLDALAEALFSAHMVQHLLLMLVAAPLVILGAPLQVIGRGLSRRRRRALARWQGRQAHRARAAPWLPAAALAGFVLIMTLWHVPSLYDLAVRLPAVHVVEHLTMFGAALAFWSLVVRRRLAAGWSALMLLGATVTGGLLSALMTFAPTAWYSAYAASTRAWGLTPLEDQQAAGAVMWVPGGMVYLLAAAIVLLRWLREDQQRAARMDAARDRRALRNAS